MGKDTSDIFQQCVRLLLRPLAAFSLRRALKVQDFIELAKQCFIDEARRQILSLGEEPSISKLSAITGLHRRDVTRLTGARDDPGGPQSLIFKVIGQWQQDHRFTTSSGRPRQLNLSGKQSEFAELITSVSKDLSPYAVRFELERLGLVQENSGRLRLLGDTYVPKGDTKRGFTMLSRDCDDLIRAVEQNVLSKPEIPNLHIKTHYDNIAVESLPKIKQWILDKGMHFHKEMRDFIAGHDKDINPELKNKIGGARIAVGTFSICDNSCEKATDKRKKLNHG